MELTSKSTVDKELGKRAINYPWAASKETPHMRKKKKRQFNSPDKKATTFFKPYNSVQSRGKSSKCEKRLGLSRIGESSSLIHPAQVAIV